MSQTTLTLHGKSVPLELHDNEAVCDIIRRTSTFYEIEILEFIRRNFPKQRTIADVGANIGNHAVYFLEFLEVERLICFEPFPPNAALLERNLAGRATIERTALGDAAYTTGMKYVPGNLGSPFLDRATPGGVPVRTLDSYALTDLTLLKIDVEIHYMEVLRGATETLRRCRPVLILEGNYDEVFPFLIPFGYAVVAFWKHYNTHCLLPLFSGRTMPTPSAPGGAG